MADRQLPEAPPKDQSDFLSDSATVRIRDGLCRIHAEWLENHQLPWTRASIAAKGTAELRCLWKIYDLHAAVLMEDGVSLTDSLLADSIPVLVFRAAKDLQWMTAESPSFVTHFVRTVEIAGARPSLWARLHAISANELKDCKLPKNFGLAFTACLESRFLHWQAERNSAPRSGGSKSEGQPRTVELKSRRGRKKGGSRETADLNDAIREAKKDGYTSTIDILGCLTRRDSIARVPLPSGWHKKYGLKDWQMVQAKCARDENLLKLVRKRFSKVKV